MDSRTVILTVAVHLVHIFRWYADYATLLDDLWVFAYNALDILQVFHGDL